MMRSNKAKVKNRLTRRLRRYARTVVSAGALMGILLTSTGGVAVAEPQAPEEAVEDHTDGAVELDAVPEMAWTEVKETGEVATHTAEVGALPMSESSDVDQWVKEEEEAAAALLEEEPVEKLDTVIEVEEVPAEREGESVYRLSASFEEEDLEQIKDPLTEEIPVVSFVSEDYVVPAERVEKPKVNGVSKEGDDAAIVSAPEVKEIKQEAADLPEPDFEGTLLSVDTSGEDVTSLKDVTLDIVMDAKQQDALTDLMQRTPDETTWSVYSGDLNAFQATRVLRTQVATRQAGSTATLVIQVAGDRYLNESQTNDASRIPERLDNVYRYTPGEGAVLELYAPHRTGNFGNSEANQEFNYSNTPRKINQPWAECTADANGECRFDIPTSGPDTYDYYWVGMKSASPGYRVQELLQPRSSGLFDNFDAETLRYAYATPHMRDGGTFYSGTFHRQNSGKNGSDWQTWHADNQYYANSSSFMWEVKSPTRASLEFAPWTDSRLRSSTGLFHQVRDNPELPNRCGLNAALVLDTSGSMGRQGVETVRDVATNIINDLGGSGVRLGLVNFNTNSPGERPTVFDPQTSNIVEPMSLNDPAQRQRAINWLGDLRGSSTTGATNWEAGLKQIADHNARSEPRDQYDVIYFITDGNPTKSLTGTTSGEGLDSSLPGNGVHTTFRQIEAAMGMANTLKSQGTRVVPIGIPTGWVSVNDAPRVPNVAVPNLEAISGGTGQQNELTLADYGIYNNAQVLRQAIVNQLNTCAITVERRLYEGSDPDAVPSVQNTSDTKANNFGFTGTLTPGQPQDLAVQNPMPQPREGYDNNIATIELSDSVQYSQVAISENPSDVPDGWVRMDAAGGQRAECVLNDASGSTQPVPVVNAEPDNGQTNDFSLRNVPSTGGIHCIVYYRLAPEGFSFDLIKVDHENQLQPLMGADFSLRPVSPEGSVGEVIAPTDVADPAQRSTFSWEDLAYGRYQLTELRAPSHEGAQYSLLAEPVLFEVRAPGAGQSLPQLFINGAEVSGPDHVQVLPVVGFGSTNTANNTVHVEMKLANVRIGDLPKTGGSGVWLVLLLGVVVIAAGAYSLRRP